MKSSNEDFDDLARLIRRDWNRFLKSYYMVAYWSLPAFEMFHTAVQTAEGWIDIEVLNKSDLCSREELQMYCLFVLEANR